MLNSKFIGNKIATARKKMNLSQAELARQVSISSQAVGKWERAESMPDITTLNRLAEILGVDLNYFSENFQSLETEVKTAEFSGKQSNVLPTVEQKSRPSRNMSENSWVDADFSGLNNINEKWNSSNIQNCKFIGSDLAGLLLKSNEIKNSDFSSSNLSRCRFQTSDLISNNFKDCSLTEAEFARSTVKGCDFSAADLTKAFFNFSAFLKNILTNAVLNAMTFKNTQIEEVVFEGTIENCHFENCSFKAVKFQNASIKNTFFKYNRNLNRVQFIDCKADNITYAFLKNGKADLTGITLLL